MFQLTNVKALQLFQLIRQGVLILVSILLTKSVLSTEEIGSWELVFYIGSSISFFWISGLMQGALARFPRLDQKGKRSFLWNVYMILLGLAIVSALLLSIGKHLIFGVLGQAQPAFFQQYILYFLLSTPCFILEYLYLLHNRPKQILAWGIFSFGAFLLAVTLPVFAGYGLEVSFQCLIVLAALRHVWTLRTLLKFSQFSLRIDLIKPFLVVALPLIAYAFIGAFAFIFDKWLISYYYRSEEIFAIFSYGARELPLATALSAAFSNAMVPVLGENLQGNLVALKDKTRKLQLLIFPVGIVLMLTSRYWFPIVFNPDFQESALIFNVYLLIIISRLLFPQTIIIALQETKLMLGISILEILLNIALSLLLIPYFGLAGVAFATFVAYLFEKVLLAVFLYRKYDLSISAYMDMKVFLGLSVLMVIAFCWQ